MKPLTHCNIIIAYYGKLRLTCTSCWSHPATSLLIMIIATIICYVIAWIILISEFDANIGDAIIFTLFCVLTMSCYCYFTACRDIDIDDEHVIMAI